MAKTICDLLAGLAEEDPLVLLARWMETHPDHEFGLLIYHEAEVFVCFNTEAMGFALLSGEMRAPKILTLYRPPDRTYCLFSMPIHRPSPTP